MTYTLVLLSSTAAKKAAILGPSDMWFSYTLEYMNHRQLFCPVTSTCSALNSFCPTSPSL
ncbi:MAG: hypothetical protein ACP5T5_05965 [Thermoprotei archaeon]